ncbi:hypothetical protein OSB04_006049 [Centaurea solstitialis]|uniref:Jacalin-type lectin domain-containing protein n=1 Tax=Centaurea solstitialis TaxID=347529 RepID=A0AA38TIY2_9ASTR|nr:hypothetical protein OSB04_006049 [Centaurea solstitialis]
MESESNSEGCITLGPWGGPKGEPWIWMAKGGIKKITIIHRDVVIDRIKFHSDDCTGETESPFYGHPIEISKKETICIDYPNEHLVSISGTYDYHIDNCKVVLSLCFVTNKKRYGPYGSDFGTRFSYGGKGGVIVGFHGRADYFLNAIGVYLMPESLAFGPNSTSDEKSRHESCSGCMSKMLTPKEAGPWGASVGKLWDDGVFPTVKQVNVFTEESLKVLRSIQFVYAKRDAKLFLSPMHGGTCEDNLELASMVNLDGTGEYLTQISGFYGPVKGFKGQEAITSITFHTNKTFYGPYGEEGGDGYTYFTSSKSIGKVVGFHGRKCNGLETESNSERFITHGPWGGSSGESWTWMPKGIIKKITIIHHQDVIDSIKFHSDDCTSETESPFYGRPCGNPRRTDTICIDYPKEYFVSISGTYGWGRMDDTVAVKSLCFVTNKKRYGPYGLEVGSRFSYDGKGGVIVGFHGRADCFLNAIGIYLMPGSLAFCRNYMSEESSMQELCSSCMSRLILTPKEAGPWGASVGKLWDDGVFSTVKHINVFMDQSLKVLRAIQFVYLKRDAKLFSSSVHGGMCDDKMEQASLVNLDGKDEYLTRISGFYGPVEGFKGQEAITSITFHTNKTFYGPYGEEGGDGYTYFTSTESPGKVVGFHGKKCNGFLTAIGVHMEYL